MTLSTWKYRLSCFRGWSMRCPGHFTRCGKQLSVARRHQWENLRMAREFDSQTSWQCLSRFRVPSLWSLVETATTAELDVDEVVLGLWTLR